MSLQPSTVESGPLNLTAHQKPRINDLNKRIKKYNEKKCPQRRSNKLGKRTEQQKKTDKQIYRQKDGQPGKRKKCDTNFKKTAFKKVCLYGINILKSMFIILKTCDIAKKDLNVRVGRKKNAPKQHLNPPKSC